MPRRRVALLTLLLLTALIGGTGLWLRAERRQYALNRALIAALMEEDNKQALALVNEGANPNTRYKPTPVPSLPKFVRQLFHRSSSSSSGSETPRDKQTALMIACGPPSRYEGPWPRLGWPNKARVQLVKAMLTHGAEVNVTDVVGRTPLMIVAGSQDSDLVRSLIEHGANVSTQDSDGKTALYYALSNKDLMRFLLAHGANPNVTNKEGTSLLSIAKELGRPDLVTLMRHNGARK